MNNQWLTISQLDRQLKEWRTISIKYPRPKAGWVKTLRVALNMSAEQLANRLGLTRSRITQLENAEIHDAVTLRTLKETANAMGCEFVYAIVPKNQPTLEDIIKNRAEQIAMDRVARVAHSMSLEAQTVNTNILKKQKDDLSKRISEHLNKKFWSPLKTLNPTQEDKIRKLAESISNHLIKTKKPEDNMWEKLTKKTGSAFIKELIEILNRTLDYDATNESYLLNILRNPDYVEVLKREIFLAQQKNDDKVNYLQREKLKKLIEHLNKKK